jgi:hypothetical protein
MLQGLSSTNFFEASTILLGDFQESSTRKVTPELDRSIMDDDDERGLQVAGLFSSFDLLRVELGSNPTRSFTFVTAVSISPCALLARLAGR